MFGSISTDQFLSEYWHKKPLLIRQAFPGFRSPLRPEELAGLACEEGVESRLILEKGGKYPWELRFGPFSDRDFRKLPASHWTLLVQEVDRLHPDVRSIVEHFRFIPDWRIDDVMVSYAPDEGGVGAHIDNYDVFLLQGLGKRRWQINNMPVQEEELIEDLDVSILADFEPDEEWILEPGDMLYLPPRIAHYGVAMGDCMTYSIGFRAPSNEEIISGFLSSYLGEINPSIRYADPDLKATDRPGEIDPAALEVIRNVIREAASDDAAIDRWFGRFVTESRRGHYPEPPDDDAVVDGRDVRQAVEAGREIQIAAGVRMAYSRREDGWTSFFVGGEEYELDSELATMAVRFADKRKLTADDLAGTDRDGFEMLADLVNQGFAQIGEAESS
jgi:50S ribosomal protein L16 3-hydroxylase